MEWVRTGKCKRCGNCCKGEKLGKDLLDCLLPHLQEQLKQVMGKHCKHLLHLAEGAEGAECKAICQIYSNRPWFCQEHPGCPADLLEDCGFTFIRKEVIPNGRNT